MASTRNPHVDQGYAWIVLASCFILRLLVEGFWASVGILMLQWGSYFDVSASETAWLGSMLMMLIFSTTKVASALANRFTYRIVTIGGGIIIVTCLFAMSFINHLWKIYVLMPLLGIGMGLAYQASNAAFIPFFDKHFAVANGIAAAACGVGFITFSPFIEFLVSSYGLKGALQITAAIMANVCVCGYILRPLDSKTNHGQLRNIKEVDTDCTTRKRTPNGFLKAIARDLDLSLFRKVRFIFQSVINGFLWGGFQTFIIYLYPFAVSIGISNFQSSFLLSVVGISMLIIRLIPIGYLVDRKFISAANLAGLAILTAGANMILTPFMTTFTRLSIVAGIFGCSTGIGGSFIMVVIAYSGGSKDKASGAVSWMLLSCGFGNLVWIYGCGYLYDITASFLLPMTLCGALVSCMGVILLLDPLLQRWQQFLDTKKHVRQFHEDVQLKVALRSDKYDTIGSTSRV